MAGEAAVDPDRLAGWPVLVHVGLHKCASTWLQTRLFASREAGFHLPWGRGGPAVAAFLGADPIRFDPEAARADLAAAARPGPGMAVISHEALSSRPQFGHYHAPEVAGRIRATLPGARLLVIVREQRRMVYSLYGEHVRNGGRLTLAEFVGRGDEPPGWAPPCRLAFLEYDRLQAMYEEVFGPDRVLILPLELLAADQERFTRAILAFCGLADAGRETPRVGRETVRPRWGPLTVATVRRLNGVVRGDPLGPEGGGAYRLAHRLAGRLDRLMPRGWQAGLEARQRAMIAERVGRRFEAPNRRLAVRIGMDLSCFGYYPSDEPER